MTPEDIKRLVRDLHSYIPEPTMPVTITTSDSTDVTGVTYTYSTVPRFSVGYSQKDIDEAYCKGYNEGLKVHSNGTTTLEGCSQISLGCGLCKKCGNLTPYSHYCIHCGAEILYGEDKKNGVE